VATKRKVDAEFDRVPPYSEDAERAVIGAMLLNPDSVGNAIEILHGAPLDIFYFPAHAHIYEAMLHLYREGRPIDALVLKERLLAAGRLEDVGGLTYIANLSSVVPTSANIDHYARIVRDKSVLRRLISSCTHIVAQAFDGPEDVASLLDRAEGSLFQIAEQRQVNPIEPIDALLKESVDRIETNIRSHSAVTGLATGLDKLDELTAGFQPSDMVVLAARPSVGKTALALNIARHAAVDNRKGVLIFSLEMSKSQLVQRLLCMQGKVNSMRLRTGFLAADEFRKIQAAAGELHGAPIHIDDTPGITVMELRAKARRHAARNECGLIIVDYLQLMSGMGRSESRQVEISDISRAIKGIARELRLPILALSQLSREADKDDIGRPKLSHLRESGAIEQDADVVLMLYRPKTELAPGMDALQVNLDLAKQRNGPTGEISLIFEKNYQRFGVLAQPGAGRSGPPEPDYPGGYRPDSGDEETPF
jgi:replicative DNA helicase